MADKASQLVLRALATAAAEGGDLPLHSTRGVTGLFPSSPPGKQAALRCCEEGLLSPASDTCSSDMPRVRLTEKGLNYLLAQVSPRQVLEDFVRALEARESQLAQLLGTARQIQNCLQTLRGHVESTLARIGSPAGDLKTFARHFHDNPDTQEAILDVLAARPATAHSDYPLPEVYRQVLLCCPNLTIGAFQDALRRLEQAGRLYLHPWTGPLHEMPQPAFALMTGHGIAYYASLRPEQQSARQAS